MDDITTRLLFARPTTFAIVMTALTVAVWSWQLFVIRSLADIVARTVTGSIAMVHLVGGETIASVMG